MDTDKMISLGRREDRFWYLEIVICKNAEILFDAAEDPTGNGYKDEARHAVDEAQTALYSACCGYAETSGTFGDWTGGRYGSQRDAYGYQVLRGVAARVWSVEIDEDGEEYGRAYLMGLPNAPEEMRRVPETILDSVNFVCNAAYQAISRVVDPILASD